MCLVTVTENLRLAEINNKRSIEKHGEIVKDLIRESQQKKLLDCIIPLPAANKQMIMGFQDKHITFAIINLYFISCFSSLSYRLMQ